MSATTSYGVDYLFNSQPHIDGIEDGLVCTEEHKNDDFTFMLKHKHFDLSPGEVLFVEKVRNGYNVIVTNSETLGETSSPCMWLYDSGWKPFGYTKAALGYNAPPNVREGNYNIGIRWLNGGGIEHTDEKQRLQWIRPDHMEGKPIITLVNWIETSGCTMKCMQTKCIDSGKGHNRNHIGIHYPDRK